MSTQERFLGIDVGSVSTNLVILDTEGQVQTYIYRRTRGEPIVAVQEGLKELQAELDGPVEIIGVGTTGSARYLTGVIVGADIVKNEITAHAVGAGHEVPGVRTVLEIGGQDSKIIFLKDGIVVDFAMNTVCAAGTGSFLDHQSARLGIPIEKFGDHALQAEDGALIAGRCSVFAESDMIHKQQVGYKLSEPICFQGGVAANAGMKRAFEEALQTDIHVPENFSVMGAIGAALLVREEMMLQPRATAFKGFGAAEVDYKTSSFACNGCENNCEIIKIIVGSETLARWGGRCGKWEVDQVRRQNLSPVGADCADCE